MLECPGISHFTIQIKGGEGFVESVGEKGGWQRNLIYYFDICAGVCAYIRRSLACCPDAWVLCLCMALCGVGGRFCLISNGGWSVVEDKVISKPLEERKNE